jgi:putative transposase
MARALRLELPGTVWHITGRGNERRDIVRDDADRQLLLDLVAEAVGRFRWNLYQYVLMTNHYHFVIHLTAATLSSGMKWLNSGYAQAFNRRHERVGHLFQGRFKGRLVQEEAYLAEVLRYVALNPVRAGMVARPEDYRWSSHRAMAGLDEVPPWLAIDRALRWLAPRRDIAQALYRRYVDEGIGLDRCPWDDVIGGIYLGTESWVEDLREVIESKPRSDEYPMEQKEPIELSMADVIGAVAASVSVSENLIRFGRGGPARMLAAWLGCHEGRLDLRSIAAALRVRSTGGISRLIRACEDRLRSEPDLRAAADRCIATLRGV